MGKKIASTETTEPSFSLFIIFFFMQMCILSIMDFLGSGIKRERERRMRSEGCNMRSRKRVRFPPLERKGHKNTHIHIKNTEWGIETVADDDDDGSRPIGEYL